MTRSAENDATDVYAVGVLHMLQVVGRTLTVRHADLRGKRLAIARREVRKEWRYIWGYCIKGRRWGALRNTFNGYLAEHRHGGHNCGTGWTKRAAIRRAERLCTRVTPPASTEVRP